jgi:hypothetical protein
MEVSKMAYVITVSLRVPIERRKNPRYFIKLPLDYRRVGTSEFRYGHTVDFCDGGLKIAAVEPIETGAEIETKIYFASAPGLVVIPAIGKVVWTTTKTDKNGFIHFGVSFLEISPKDLVPLKSFLRNYADPTSQPVV